MEFNLADLFEAAVDAYPEREYLVADGERLELPRVDISMPPQRLPVLAPTAIVGTPPMA